MVTEKSCKLSGWRGDLPREKGAGTSWASLKNIYQRNSYRKDLSCPHFNDKPRVQEKQQVKDQLSCIFIFVVKQQLGAPAQTWQQYSINGHMIDLLRYRPTSGERNFIERIKALIFLDAVLAIEIMYEPQSNLEERVNPGILKDGFSSRTDPPIFTSIEPVLLDWSNKTSWVFPALKSTSYFLPQSTVSGRSDSSLETNSSCYHRSDAWSHLE